MKLPINYEDAVNEWDRFEDYLIQERYAVRDPETGKATEKNLSQVLKRISNEFSYPGISKALQKGYISWCLILRPKKWCDTSDFRAWTVQIAQRNLSKTWILM